MSSWRSTTGFEPDKFGFAPTSHYIIVWIIEYYVSVMISKLISQTMTNVVISILTDWCNFILEKNKFSLYQHCIWFALLLWYINYCRLLMPNLSLYISSSSSSCHAASTDIPDPLSPLLPIVHRLWQVFRATSRILTELLNVCSSWPSCFCSAICGGP